jgi:hypothetical protein
MTARILFLLTISLSVFGQSKTAFLFVEDSAKYTVDFRSTFDANSNSVPNTMLSKILWGGYMSPQFLKETRDKLPEKNNRFGFLFHTSLQTMIQKGNRHWVVGIRYKEAMGLRFSRDLFGLGFLGNAEYESQTANLSNTRFEYWQYTSLNFGLVQPLGKSSKLYVAISPVLGLNYQKLSTKEAYLYTAQGGEYLALDANMELQYFDREYTGNKNVAGAPGLGLGLDLGYEIAFGANKLTLQIEDLGFARWAPMTTYKTDSSFEYRGERVDNLVDFNGDSLFSDFSSNGFARKFGVKSTVGNKKSILLPFSLSLLYTRQLSHQWQASLHLHYLYLPAYTPKATVQIEKSFLNHWKTSLGLSYGGFGKANTILGAQKTFKHQWTVSLDAYFLGMALLPSNSHGVGVNFGVRKGF